MASAVCAGLATKRNSDYWPLYVGPVSVLVDAVVLPSGNGHVRYRIDKIGFLRLLYVGCVLLIGPAAGRCGHVHRRSATADSWLIIWRPHGASGYIGASAAVRGESAVWPTGSWDRVVFRSRIRCACCCVALFQSGRIGFVPATPYTCTRITSGCDRYNCTYFCNVNLVCGLMLKRLSNRVSATPIPSCDPAIQGVPPHRAWAGLLWPSGGCGGSWTPKRPRVRRNPVSRARKREGQTGNCRWAWRC